jgi:hypothetical protein
MTHRLVAALLLFVALTIFAAACSSGSSNPTTAPASSGTLDGATLLQERCTGCHSLGRVESSKHTATEWKTIVGTMISRGAQLNAAEETAVVDYLAANYGK